MIFPGVCRACHAEGHKDVVAYYSICSPFGADYFCTKHTRAILNEPFTDEVLEGKEDRDLEQATMYPDWYIRLFVPDDGEWTGEPLPENVR